MIPNLHNLFIRVPALPGNLNLKVTQDTQSMATSCKKFYAKRKLDLNEKDPYTFDGTSIGQSNHKRRKKTFSAAEALSILTESQSESESQSSESSKPDADDPSYHEISLDEDEEESSPFSTPSSLLRTLSSTTNTSTDDNSGIYIEILYFIIIICK